MSETFQHTCIRPECVNTYKDNDPDAYYCESCKKERQALAKELDKKFSTTESKNRKSLIQEYDEAPKVHGFMRVKL